MDEDVPLSAEEWVAYSMTPDERSLLFQAFEDPEQLPLPMSGVWGFVTLSPAAHNITMANMMRAGLVESTDDGLLLTALGEEAHAALVILRDDGRLAIPSGELES
jgi:hypothetical protein